MHYPRNEKGELYGMPKGEKVKDEKPVDLAEVNKKRLEDANKEIEERNKVVKKDGNYEPIREKPKKKK